MYKRIIDLHLDQWKKDSFRKPLLLRGARQVGNTLRSLYLFLETHPKSTSAIRFSALNYSIMNKLDSRPLYAAVSMAHESQSEALEHLVT